MISMLFKKEDPVDNGKAVFQIQYAILSNPSMIHKLES